ncbi:MAG: hypothetical protein QME90_06640 [Thermodesulfobacteriota bacterium]|nr:hypothetical protein [Thermodesulfobacteriota bacterium]
MGESNSQSVGTIPLTVAYTVEEKVMENHLQILRASSDPKALKTAAEHLAASRQPEDHAALKPFLADSVFLSRLNTLKDYDHLRPKHLRLWWILDVLSRNIAPSAHRVLIELTASPAYNNDRMPSTAALLIQACARIRPAPPEVVAYWDRHCRPDDGYAPLTIEALLENRSPPALALLEKKMAESGHEDDTKIAWMHKSILPRRNDLAVLQCCHRMLTGTLSPSLRPALVETLFDYRPGEWYTARSPVARPPRHLMTDPAKDELRKIGEFALDSITLTQEQALVVKAVLSEIGDREKKQ